jgi:hypothetical protein
METSGPISDRNDSFYILCALAGVIVALLAVGVVSHLIVRHIIQVTPAAIAAIFVARAGRAARYAALPIFIFWLLIMTAIWLFLLGVARIVSGTFTAAEITLTIVIGFCCLWGIVAVLRRPRAGPLAAIIYFGAFAVLQFAGLWISMQPAFARR